MVKCELEMSQSMKKQPSWIHGVHSPYMAAYKIALDPAQPINLQLIIFIVHGELI